MANSREGAPTEDAVRLIDPTNMSEAEADIVLQFLTRQLQKGEGFIDKETAYVNVLYHDPHSDLNLLCDLQFRYSLAWYIDAKHPERDCFAVIGNTCLGEGDTAEVFKVKGKLKVEPSGRLVYVSNKSQPSNSQKTERSKYAIKIEKHSYRWPYKGTLGTYYLSCRNKKLGVSYPNFFSTENKSVTVMKRLKDYNFDQVLGLREDNPALFNKIMQKTTRWELYELFRLEESGLFTFSDFDRLVYARAILQAYNEQVSGLKIEHRDIKAENIIVDYACYPPEVTFFDYGLARDARAQDECGIQGTVGYIAPEVLKKKGAYTGKSDLYSLACVLAQLWGDVSVYADRPATDKLGYSQAINRKFTFHEGTPQVVIDILQRMVACRPQDRPSSDEAIAVFNAEIERYEAEILQAPLFQ